MKNDAEAVKEAVLDPDHNDSSALQLSSRELFRHANTVRIEHNGEHYCLRRTRGNKLILTK